MAEYKRSTDEDERAQLAARIALRLMGILEHLTPLVRESSDNDYDARVALVERAEQLTDTLYRGLTGNSSSRASIAELRKAA